MNKIINDSANGLLKFRQNTSVGRNKVNNVCYADHVPLIAAGEDNLQRLLYQLNKYVYNSNVIIEKTNCTTTESRLARSQ